MSNVAKRINIVSIKMVKESSFLYRTHQILSPNDTYEMIKDKLQDLDREQFIIACLNTKNEPTNISVVASELLGIKLLDHLIIGDGFPALRSKYPPLVGYGTFTSLKEKGYL